MSLLLGIPHVNHITWRWSKWKQRSLTLLSRICPLGTYKLSPKLCKLLASLSAVSLHPSLVNVHIQHPPEAEVHIHQVARVQPGQRPSSSEVAHSVQQRSQPGNGHETHSNGNGNGHNYGHARPHNRQNGHVGRCFQETVDGQVLYQAIQAHRVHCQHSLM